MPNSSHIEFIAIAVRVNIVPVMNSPGRRYFLHIVIRQFLPKSRVVEPIKVRFQNSCCINTCNQRRSMNRTTNSSHFSSIKYAFENANVVSLWAPSTQKVQELSQFGVKQHRRLSSNTVKIILKLCHRLFLTSWEYFIRLSVQIVSPKLQRSLTWPSWFALAPEAMKCILTHHIMW